jgi:pSer/pThr/pTyr-binding forkhead associated (FHA) protein
MVQSPDAYLIVEKGLPYSAGDVLPLFGGTTLLGRNSKECQNDIAFTSPFVSRRHAVIEGRDGEFTLTSLIEAKHGTTVKGVLLEPGAPYTLRAGDRIGLTDGLVVLVFAVVGSAGSETWDFPARPPEPREPPKPEPPVAFNPERREVIVDGSPRTLTDRLFNLFSILYDNRGRAVSDLEIKKAVWSDYELGVDGKPLVTDQELSTLKYRLCQILEPHGDLIRALRGYGYMLDLPR